MAHFSTPQDVHQIMNHPVVKSIKLHVVMIATGNQLAEINVSDYITKKPTITASTMLFVKIA